MSEPRPTEQPSNTQNEARVGATNLTNTHQPDGDVRQIAAGEEADTTFRPVYTALDEDIEVELVKRVPASESDHKFGHAVIDRPEWEDTRTALLQNIRVDVIEGADKGDFDE